MAPDRTPKFHRTTLGILAGGRAIRLGCSDKAWAMYGGKPLIERILQGLGDSFAERVVSTNRDFARYDALGLRAVPDRIAEFPGPMAGLDALLATCATPWLMCVPVDLRAVPQDLVERLHAAGEGGAVARDASGLQPLIALWPVGRARVAVEEAFARGEHAVHGLVETLALSVVHFEGADFGNLNTPADFLS
jgi:molybdopterin-guanine dinucleotide biosynthesis protein A